MKIAFIQPYYHNIWEAAGIGSVAAYARKNFRGKLAFSFFQSYFDDDAAILRGAKSADLVAFSCTSPAYAHGVRLARRLKKLNPRIRVVFGGHHVSALADRIDEPCIDHLAIGEGETAFLEILEGSTDRIVRGRPLPFAELPWPDRELIRNDRTVALACKQAGVRIASFQANRVCPFRCGFCSERVITGPFNRTTNPVRTRDVRDLADEIEATARRYDLDYFKFTDATFNTSTQYVIAFCEELLRRNVRLDWECMVHAGLAQREIFRWMAKAGCRQIDVGCESGSPRILRLMRKGSTVKSIRDVFASAKESGLRRRSFFILGHPDEQEEDLRMTESLARELQPDVFGATILCPYPGCDFYDHGRLKDIDWSKTDEYSNDFWCTEQLTNRRLKAWQRRLAREFRPVLAWHQRTLRGPRRARRARSSQ